MGWGLFIAVFFAFFLEGASALADTTLEIKRYRRCYERFTSSPVPSGDVYLSQIKSGAIVGIGALTAGSVACQKLLTDAALGPTSQIDTTVSVNLKVLRKFHEIHRGFISIQDYFNSIDPNNTPNIIDGYESANAFTYFVLKAVSPVSKLLTDPISYQALRDGTAGTRKLLFPQDALAISDVNGAAYVPPVPIKEGNLIGIQVPASSPLNLFPLVTGTTQVGKNAGTLTTSTNVESTNMNANLGAGILGTQSYLLSTDVNYGMVQNGGTLLRRRWMKYVIKDLLCLDLPVIRNSDVASGGAFFGEIVSAPTASTLPFRQGASCVKCHTTMDKGASFARNLISVKSTYADDNHIGMGFVVKRTSDVATSAVFPVADDASYFKRPADGALVFRDYSGVLTNASGTGLSSLATKIATTQQFHACLAAKYYLAMTGISVNLADASDPAAPLNLNTDQNYHRNQVIALGTKLKGTSGYSLRDLIIEIVTSDAFVKPYQGAP